MGEEDFENGNGVGAGILDAMPGTEVRAFIVYLAVVVIPATVIVSAGVTLEGVEYLDWVGKIGVIHNRRRFPILPQ